MKRVVEDICEHFELNELVLRNCHSGSSLRWRALRPAFEESGTRRRLLQAGDGLLIYKNVNRETRSRVMKELEEDMARNYREIEVEYARFWATFRTSGGNRWWGSGQI